MDFEEYDIDELTRFLDCEYETLTNTDSVDMLMAKYSELLQQGKSEGFTPLIIVPSSTLLEMLGFFSEQNMNRESIISKAETIDAENFLEERYSANAAYITDDTDEIYSGESITSFGGTLNYSTGRPYDELIIAKIPTDKPWELAAWVPMGGFNDCPSPLEQIAVFRHWYEKYGAVPAVVTSDIWNMYVPNPITTQDESKQLAKEQFAFCGDIVWQGAESLAVLAGSLVNSSVWYFWWD